MSRTSQADPKRTSPPRGRVSPNFARRAWTAAAADQQIAALDRELILHHRFAKKRRANNSLQIVRSFFGLTLLPGDIQV